MREIVKAADVQVFFGKSISISYKILKQILNELDIKNRKFVTITEFDNYFGLKTNGIRQTIIDRDILIKATPKKAKSMDKGNEIKIVEDSSETYTITKKTWK